MRRLLRAGRRVGLFLASGAITAAWLLAGRGLVGQETADGPIPPMMVDSGAVVGAESLAGFRERSEDPGRPVDWFNLGAGLLLTADWEGAL
ncbi:MAG: hypothetical protein WBP17_09680, partial [Gemmatimonadota bacterium]